MNRQTPAAEKKPPSAADKPSSAEKKLPKAVLLAGPTACGKSALAQRLCERFHAEIISVDSCAVYRGMNIGAAKPSAAVRARVRHHLLDIRLPSHPYSAGAFCRDATAAIREIASRGALPILVGGTMLYFRALLCGGLHRFPHVPEEVRTRVRAEMKKRGALSMHRELEKADPDRAAQIHPADSQRIGRALEICRSGVAMSAALRAAKSPPQTARYLSVALIPEDRKRLYDAIERRLEEMFAAGFIAEVKALAADYKLGADATVMRAVGYRQVFSHLCGECDAAEARRRALVATRRLAKRQLTWLRAADATTTKIIDPFDKNAAAKIAACVAAYTKSEFAR